MDIAERGVHVLREGRGAASAPTKATKDSAHRRSLEVARVVRVPDGDVLDIELETLRGEGDSRDVRAAGSQGHLAGHAGGAHFVQQGGGRTAATTAVAGLGAVSAVDHDEREGENEEGNKDASHGSSVGGRRWRRIPLRRRFDTKQVYQRDDNESR